jgi:Kdo2-lipid IVA lauroyltransferase/acyltransferase
MEDQKTISIKQKIMDAALSFGIKSMSLLPLGAAQKIGALIGNIVALFPNNSMSRVARINIDLCLPDWSKDARKKLVKQTVSQAIVTGAEMPYTFMRSPETILGNIKSVKGNDAVETSLRDGNGALMVGPHIGSWEMAIIYMAKSFPTSVLYSAPKIPKMDELIYDARTRSGLKMLPATPTGVKQLYKTLASKKEVVALLTDQVPPGGKGASYVPFFGMDAWTMSFPSKLYERYKPDVFLIYCVRLGLGKGFEMRFEPMAAYIEKAEQLAEVEDTFAHACSMAYEKIILEQPEQYQWIYKRFKHQPQGIADYYRK